MAALHFLQEHDIGRQAAQAFAQVPQHGPAHQLRQTAVDVVRGDSKAHGLRSGNNL